MGFLKQLMASLRAAGKGKTPQAAKVRVPSRDEILRRPEFRLAAYSAGARRRLESHRRCCLQAYAAKIAQSKKQHSNHTTRGIPQEYLA